MIQEPDPSFKNQSTWTGINKSHSQNTHRLDIETWGKFMVANSTVAICHNTEVDFVIQLSWHAVCLACAASVDSVRTSP